MVSRKGKDNTGRKGANETGFLFLLKLVKILTIVLTKGKKRDKIIYGLWLPKRRDTACYIHYLYIGACKNPISSRTFKERRTLMDFMLTEQQETIR